MWLSVALLPSECMIQIFFSDYWTAVEIIMAELHLEENDKK